MVNILETRLSVQNPGMQFLWLIFRHQDDFIALTAIIGIYSLGKELASLKFKTGHTHAGNKVHIPNSSKGLAYILYHGDF